MRNAGIFYGHLEYFTVIYYILWPFGIVVVILYIFSRFGILCQEKSGNPVLNFQLLNCGGVEALFTILTTLNEANILGRGSRVVGNSAQVSILSGRNSGRKVLKTTIKHHTNLVAGQGDQIGRLFIFWQFFEKLHK
jgi:hypothetical protein